MSDERCGNCKYWHHRYGVDDESHVPGVCRRHAPVIREFGRQFEWVDWQSEASARPPVWPGIRYNDWCGDYEVREKQA